MAYIVNIQTGSKAKKNFTRSQSIALSNKEKVRAWIKRNNTGNINTQITIKNTISKKILRTTKGSGAFYGRNVAKEVEKRIRKRRLKR